MSIFPQYKQDPSVYAKGVSKAIPMLPPVQLLCKWNEGGNHDSFHDAFVLADAVDFPEDPAVVNVEIHTPQTLHEKYSKTNLFEKGTYWTNYKTSFSDFNSCMDVLDYLAIDGKLGEVFECDNCTIELISKPKA